MPSHCKIITTCNRHPPASPFKWPFSRRTAVNSSPRFSSFACSRREPMKIRGRGFHWLDALPVPQLTVSNHQAYGLQIARCSNHQRLRNLRGPTGTTGWLNKSQLRVHKCKLKSTAKYLRAMVKNYKAFN